MRLSRSLLLALAAAASFAALPSRAQTLPAGFVYLRDIDPSIVQDIRYAGSNNFVGRPVSGYQGAECVLTEPAARALAAAQKNLAAKDLSLIVWDCYRPKRAVQDFIDWSRNPAPSATKEEFFPRTDKRKLFALGYIAARSGHSRGSTVDVGLVPKTLKTAPVRGANAQALSCTQPKGSRFEDGTIDLGTGYDCLDARAATWNMQINPAARANRLTLRSAMIAAGFRPYFREWWHFALGKEPFPGREFDFPVVGRK